MSEQACVAMPEYVSHKRVRALKLKELVKLYHDGRSGDEWIRGVLLRFDDSRFTPLELDVKFALRIRWGSDPGYYVVYEDGYQSWSPTQAFEEGYTRVES